MQPAEVGNDESRELPPEPGLDGDEHEAFTHGALAPQFSGPSHLIQLTAAQTDEHHGSNCMLC